MSDIKRLANRIADEFNPEKIILFGSYASGKPSADSDVDLLVILPHTGKSWRLAAEIRTRIRPAFPIDLLVRAGEELDRRVAEGDPFLITIIKEGKVLYEKHHQ
ncbi:MAG: nucleotidyltransferase domain-containing protein [Pseudomonadota bacterium]